MHRLGLRDDEWDRIEHLLPGRQGWVGVTAKDNRLFVEAVLYRCRTGVPWRDLPEHFGDWKNTHRRYSRWAKSGVWERYLSILRPMPTTNTRCSTAPLCALISIVPAPQKPTATAKPLDARAAD